MKKMRNVVKTWKISPSFWVHLSLFLFFSTLIAMMKLLLCTLKNTEEVSQQFCVFLWNILKIIFYISFGVTIKFVAAVQSIEYYSTQSPIFFYVNQYRNLEALTRFQKNRILTLFRLGGNWDFPLRIFKKYWTEAVQIFLIFLTNTCPLH